MAKQYSKSRPNDHVAHQIYGQHLKGSRNFMNNPTNNRQAIIERMYIRTLTEMCVNRFKWVNVPPSIDTRFLEMTLFRNALAVWYFDDDFDKFFSLRASGWGQPNMYDNPQHFQVYGNALLNKRLSVKECVPIWANFTRTQDLDIVLIYANKLAGIDRTIEINARNARSTKIVVADENARLSATNITRKMDEGQSPIFLDTGLGEMVTVFDAGISGDSVEKLHILRTRLWNECMGLLGINSANQDKKERLVEDEVSANDDQVEISRGVNLNARQEAAKKINEMSRFLNGQTMTIDGVDRVMPDWPELDISVEYANSPTNEVRNPVEMSLDSDDNETGGEV